jgi:hypothetical protein
MDELQIAKLVKKCKLLKFKFMGVYAADNFPAIKSNSFQIVNASSSTNSGSHWLLFCGRGDEIIFADPLEFKMEDYRIIYRRAIKLYDNVRELLHARLQPLDSSACGLYCLYLAHEVFSSGRYPNITFIGETDLYRFVKHMY